MRTAFKILAAASALMFAVPASAAVTVTFNDGGSPLSPGETIFANFNDGSDDAGVTGSGFLIQSGSNGQGADPATGGTGDPYLTVLANGVANFVFSPLALLSMDYGSADDYNTFVLTLLDGTVQSFTGSQLIAASANGNQTSPITNGRLIFSASSPAQSIVGLTIRSTQNSAEVDRFASIAAVPEPGTWAMMLLGFGAMGFSIRRRKRATARVLQLA